MQLRAKVLPAQVLKHTCLIKEKPLEMCLLRQVTAESGGEFCGKTDDPATILNHVNGSRNQVESLVKSMQFWNQESNSYYNSCKF